MKSCIAQLFLAGILTSFTQALPAHDSYMRSYDPVTGQSGPPATELGAVSWASLHYALEPNEFGAVLVHASLDRSSGSYDHLVSQYPYLAAADPVDLATLGLDVTLPPDLGPLLFPADRFVTYMTPVIEAQSADEIAPFGELNASPLVRGYVFQPQTAWASVTATDERFPLAYTPCVTPTPGLHVLHLPTLQRAAMLRQAQAYHAAKNTTLTAAETDALMGLDRLVVTEVQVVKAWWERLIPLFYGPTPQDPPRIRFAQPVVIRKRSLKE